ncbi:MAG TPA: hypothetical protein VF173_03490 [Thermoanaerobaculia bacterium]|nr:hypothetical protein [Thermoanaerobaculia bacterium]
MRRSKNAFSEEFLDLVDALDELGPSEAELAGPWQVLATEEGFGLYEQWQDAEDAPIAVFKDRATALKFSAALSAASREPLFSQDPEPGPEGRFNVTSPQGRLEGWIAHLQVRAVDLAHMADFCARSPAALAAILLAAGSATLRKTGAILSKASPAEPGPDAEATAAE